MRDNRTINDAAKTKAQLIEELHALRERNSALEAAVALANERLVHELDERREWQRITLASIGDAVIVTDAHGRVTFMNPVAEALTGWKLPEAAGQELSTVFQIIDEDTSQPVESPAARVLRSGLIVGLANHTLLIAKDGTAIPIDDSGAPIKDAAGTILGVVLVFRDITQRRRAEEELRQSRDQLDAILRGVADGISVQDTNGRLIYANDSAARITGYPSGEALMAAPLDEVMRKFAVMTPEGSPFPLDQLPGRLALQGQRNPEALLHFRVLATGEDRWSLVKAAPVFNERGRVLFAVNLFHDMTEHIQGEQQLRAQYAVTRILAEAPTLRDAAPQILQAVCESLGWEWGALWRVDQQAGALHCVETWHRPAAEMAELVQHSQQINFAPGIGLPGRVWASRQPAWIPDVLQDSNFPRGPIAARLKLHGAFCIPIRIGQTILGAMEFLSHAIRQPDAALLAMMASIGSQIGQFIERQRVEGERERLLAQQAAERALLDAVLQQLPAGVVIAEAPSGRIILSNAQAEQIIRYPFTSATNIADYARYAGFFAGERPDEDLPLARAIHTGEAVTEEEVDLLRGDGSRGTLRLSSAPVRDQAGLIVAGVLTFYDITERKRAEEAQRFLAEASNVLTGSLDYETTLARAARFAVPYLADWCAVHIREADGAIRRLAVIHVDPDKEALARERPSRYPLDPNAQHIVPQVLRTGQPELFPEVPDMVLEESARDPEHLKLLRTLGFQSYMCVPLLARGRVLGAITLVAAGSERRYGPDDLALAEELARRAANAVDNAQLYREAQQAIRLRDQFLSIASHELKTPLTTLLGNAQLLQRRALREHTSNERDQRTIRIIADQATRLNKMVAALLDISRIQGGQLSIERAPFDLCTLVRRVVEEVQPALEQHVLTCETPSGTLMMEGDELRLEQVLQNLLGNAIKYSPSGGPIVVRVEQRLDRARITVTDQGLGIPSDELPRLFQRFYRAQNVESRHISGMGVGLFVVKEIVTLHDGTVEVQSDEGQGSTFTISLPLPA